MSNTNYIQLNRTFSELTTDYREYIEGLGISSKYIEDGQVTWADLLGEYRVIILSEAGSGKTTEIRNVAQQLRAEGKSAFFLRLEHVSLNFNDCFEEGTKAEFDEWLVGNEEGWLFLDSVDEARLKSPQDFEQAIRKLSLEIQTAIERTHLFMTSRVSAWRFKTDLDFCNRHLPYKGKVSTYQVDEVKNTGKIGHNTSALAHENKSKFDSYKIVSLNDLNEEQVFIFTSTYGISEPRTFINAIERSDMWSFVTRPQDLEELTAFWLSKQRIGSRFEMIRHNIERRIKERDQNRAQMSSATKEDTYKGIRLLAAATTLLKESLIRVPDGSNNTTGITPDDILTDWSTSRISNLLACPVFDEALYGTVRFHHRSVREYLTAEWFSELLKCGTSRREIEGLFFREQYGVMVVPPALRPILAWLCVFDNNMRARTVKLFPKIALEGGDPSQWPLEERQSILHKVCKQISDNQVIRASEDYKALKRFAKEDLTNDIKLLLEQYHNNDDICMFLLSMARLGEIQGVLPDAMKLALCANTSKNQRIMAVRSVSVIGSSEDKITLIQSLINESTGLNRRILAELFDFQIVTEDSIALLVAGLEKCNEVEEFHYDNLAWEVKRFAEKVPEEALFSLIEEFNRLLEIPPVIERRHCEVSEKFKWLLEISIQAVERLVLSKNPEALMLACLSIIQKIPLAQAYGLGIPNNKPSLKEFVPKWPELNAALFWYDVNRAREIEENRSERITDFWGVSPFGSLWRFGEKDFEYIVEEISSQSLQDNKLVALSLAFYIYQNNNRPLPWRKELKRVTSNNEELSIKLSSLLRPPANPQRKKHRAQMRQLEKKQREYQFKKENELSQFKAYLHDNLETLRANITKQPGEFSNELVRLYDYLANNHDRINCRAGYNWNDLEATFGRDIAVYYRDAAVAFWPHFTPVLHSEGFPLNKTLVATIFGLIGLELEFNETPERLQNLTINEAHLACKYASFELNGFPTWFPILFESYPEIVSKFLLNEIQYELSIETSEKNVNYILSDVSWSGSWMWDALAPEILNTLKNTEPTNIENLNNMLKIVQGSSLSDAEISLLASSKCESLTDSVHLAHWYSVWVGVDPSCAIPSLRMRLASIESSDEAKNLLWYLSYIFFQND